MPHPLYTKIAGLKAKLAQQKDANLSEMLDAIEAVFLLVEQNRADLTSAYEAQIRVNQRLDELEKRLPPYQGRN